MEKPRISQEESSRAARSRCRRDITFEASCDYIVHLGDVYYAGTELAPPPGEEMQHFLQMWPAMPPGRSFTLNSNREMYGGAEKGG